MAITQTRSPERTVPGLLLGLLTAGVVLPVACVVSAEGPAAERPAAPLPSLVERLGYPAGTRLLIVNGDDAGMCHAANQATIDSLERGLMSSATVMVPCPWFLEFAEWARESEAADVGIHLTHTSEWVRYRWGPVASRSSVPGLLDPQGYLHRTVAAVHASATPDEAEIEARAQIDLALAAGIDVTHLDSHMGTLQLDPRLFEVYRRLAIDYDLPLRMGNVEHHPMIAEQRARLDADGIVYPDVLIHGGRGEDESVKDFFMRVVRESQPGVTELYIHAALATDELKAITGSWQTRAEEYHLFTDDADMRALLEAEGIELIGYRELRALQRQAR